MPAKVHWAPWRVLPLSCLFRVYVEAEDGSETSLINFRTQVPCSCSVAYFVHVVIKTMPHLTDEGLIWQKRSVQWVWKPLEGKTAHVPNSLLGNEAPLICSEGLIRMDTTGVVFISLIKPLQDHWSPWKKPEGCWCELITDFHPLGQCSSQSISQGTLNIF